MSGFRIGSALIIIRRQPVILRSSERFKIEPCPACETPQKPSIIGIQWPDRLMARTVEQHRDFGSDKPEQQERKRRRKGVRIEIESSDSKRQGGRWPRPHLPPDSDAGMPISMFRRFMRRSGPLQQIPPGHQATPRCDGHRMHGNARFERQIDNRQKPAADLITQPRKQAAHRTATTSLRHPGYKIGEYLPAMRKYCQQGPEPWISREQQPSDNNHQQQRWCYEAAAQIVYNHPLAQKGERVSTLVAICGANMGSEPRQQLPVTANPAMPAFDIFKIGSGKTFIEYDIGSESCTTERAFEQIMT